MPGTAVDKLITAMETHREQAWGTSRCRQETAIKLFRFDSSMRAVRSWSDVREREIWAQVTHIVEAMRTKAARMNRQPQRVLCVMAPAIGPVYRCSFLWELGGTPQPGDILLALFVLANRQISNEEYRYHINFLSKWSHDQKDRDYWQSVQIGKMPTVPVNVQIAAQAATEMGGKQRSKSVVWAPVAAQTTWRGIEEI